MTDAELAAVRVYGGDEGTPSAYVDPYDGARCLTELKRLRAERAELRKLAAKVRDYWRTNVSEKRDSISTPGMVLLMAVEK